MRAPLLSRRRFLHQTGVAATTLTAASWSRVYGANEKLRLASVGVGGKGWEDLTRVAASPHVSVAAVCDVDETEQHLGRAAERFASAKRFTDWRRLLGDAPKEFDAVTVSTPDHMHAPIALAAMALGKHVFCQKPLTHTVHEARQMRLAAKKSGVVTQMGNQIQSHEAYRTAVRLVHDGVIGKVKEVHSWQAGSMRWMIVDDRPEGMDPIPTTLHWDGWLGVAPERPYKAKVYHSWNWRAWQDYSNGQLGDFGCHILDPVFLALGLSAPTTVKGESSPLNREVWYRWSRVSYEFPGTDRTAGKTLKLTWHDGEGKLPPRESLGVGAGVKLPGSGSLLIGEKGSLLIPHVAMPRLLPEETFKGFAIEKVPAVDHYTGWADACRGVGKTTSHFDYAGPLTEAVLLGTVAIRVPGETLRWDAEAMKVTSSPKADGLLRKAYRKGWEPAWVL
jgi:predicted dehydrogenase